MERKIRVGAVSYLNTKPLLYGIERSAILNDIDLVTDYPSRIADMLLNDEIDMGLVPVAVIPGMKEFHINTQFCIGSDGPVASVCLFSEVPMQEIENVLLDYQSRSSVALARILLKEYWKKDPVLLDSGDDFRRQIKGTTAAVLIGDRALEQRRISKYVYDLGEAWKLHTGLPFVFAAWISNKKMDNGFIADFNRANEVGVKAIDLVLKDMEYDIFDLKVYYTRYISFSLNEEKLNGLKLFLGKLKHATLSVPGLL